ncbi:MAG: TonB-dependent receptor [Gemmatimonadetes bacterium]|nr:TonB-dependent receptor [Gemmatimonadota bacterium]
MRTLITGCVMYHRKLLVLSIVGSLLSTAVRAQDVADTTRLEDIVVTATRVPISANAVTSSVTVLQGEELRARGVTYVLDALRAVPGLSVVQGGTFGALTSVFIRGGESDYVQVLIDGVPLNQPGGFYNFANLSMANVDRIEVLRGPASVLYGSDAAAGVVQIFTRQGAGPTRASAGVRAGTYGSVGFAADVAGSTERTAYSFAVDRFVTNGIYDFNSDYDNTVVSGRFQVRPDEVTDLALNLRYRDSKFHFPTDATGNIVDQNAFTLDEATTASIDAGRFFTDRIEVRLLLASNVTGGGTNDAQDNAADTLGFYAFRSLQDLSRQSVDVRANVYPQPGLVVTAGAHFEQQEERFFNESESEFGPSNGSTDVERSNRAYYTQFLAETGPLSVVLGGRLDDNEAFGTFATYRAGGSLRWGGTTLRASVGRSFKAPTFFENFATGFVTGNPDLDPERTFSWETGLRGVLLDGRVVVAGTYFSQTFDDLIQFTFAETPNYVNVAEAEASGIEIEVIVEPVADLVVSGNYTYLDTKVVDAGFASGAGATFVEGARLLRRPASTFSGEVSFRGWDRGSFSIVVNRVGDRDDRDFGTFPAEPVVLPTYTTVDLATQVDLLPARMSGTQLTWTLRLENVFDEQYVEVFGFPARRRTVTLGGRVSR